MRIWLRQGGDRRIIILLTLAALFLFCFNLGNVPLRDWDEGTRALVAREIFRTGDWLHPTQFGEPYLLKPPLMDWLVALGYHLGGVNEWTSRLPGAIASALGVPLLFCLGRELFPGRKSAVYGALVYLTLLPVVRHGRLLMLDGMVVTAMIFSLWCLLKSKTEKIWGLGFGIGLGIIAFTKGLLMLPLAAIALFFVLWDRRWTVFQNIYFQNIYIWLGLGLGLLPVVLWYGAQIQEYGETFIQVHFLSQGFDRVADTVESHQQPPWFYLLEILKYTAPWLFFLPQSYGYCWQKKGTTAGKLILTGTLLYLGLISAMGTKLPWYIMPLYPFFALAIGDYFATGWQAKRKFLPLHWLFYFLAIATYGGTLYFFLTDPQIPLMLLAVCVGTMFVLAGWHWQWQHPKMFTIFMVGTYCILTLLFCSQSWLWEINEAFPVQPIGAMIQAQTPANATVFTTFGYRRPSLDFYGDRPVLPQPLENTQPDQYWLIDPGLLQERQQQLTPYQTLGETPDFVLIQRQ